MINPRFALLLNNYALHDRVTLFLAGLALAAAYIGWVMAAGRSVMSRFDRILMYSYFAFCLLAFVSILAGCTYILLSGGFV